MALADIFNQFIELADESNTTSTSCESGISHYKFYQFSLIPAGVLTLLFASTRTRRKRLINTFGGRPGLVFPMDTLTRSSRVSYCCAFGAMAFLVYEILLEQKFAIDYTGPVSLKTLIAILSMFVYGMVFFPVFASLALSSAFSFGVGSLYVWMFFVVDVYKVTECDLTLKGRIVMLVRAVPNLACLAYLSISLPLRFIVCCYRKHYFVKAEEKSWESLDDIKGSYQGLHVRKLLKKPEIEEDTEGIVSSAKRFAMNLIHHWIYHRQPGFRYPSRLVSVMFVSGCVVYVITVELLVGFVEMFDWMLEELDNLLDPIGRDSFPGEPKELTDYRDILLATEYLTFVSKVCLIVAVSTSCLLSLLTILHMLSSFRTNLFAMYRGDFKEIPPPSEKSAVSLCVGSMKYAGFQVAYIVWAYIITCLILFIISFVLAIVIVLLINGNTDWLINKVLQVWPGVVIAMVLMLLQILLAKYIFLQEGGEFLRLDNRHSYFIFTYFMFFYNIFLGLLSCLLRIIKAIAIGTIFLARLDNSTLPRKFEFFDPGLNAYFGYIHMEAAHTHPVVNVFLRLLTSLSQERKRKSPDPSMEMIDMPDSKSAHSEDDLKKSKPCGVNPAARFNWLVLYTLLQNPQVRMYRKGFIQAIKKARREGLKIPISDKPISDFDLVQLQKEKEEQKQANQAMANGKDQTHQGIARGVSELFSSTLKDLKPNFSNSKLATKEAPIKNGKVSPAQSPSPDPARSEDTNLGQILPEVEESSGKTNSTFTMDFESDEENDQPLGLKNTADSAVHI
ncbi:hypothetical protein RRG08_052985 [Elysia crispata]|uniref:Receptor for retinol uptake STRA6 n=1 Tax=Elysia crispata TaxID=231223 RepID=A0AAE0ZKM6_9GAST|nr:hypothetical protein RRG08_052985 [Elysia crispata]